MSGPSCDPQAVPAPKWRVSRHTTLTWRTWGAESLVFDSQTGDTHLVDPVAREGLMCLAERALDCRELCQLLGQRLDVPADEALQRFVAQLVARFSELGLLEMENR